MELLPIDVSERLYKNYSATVMNPEPLTNEMREVSGNFRATYQKGIVVPREQLFWIWNRHKKGMDFDEPYDVGVSNALALALYIVCDRDPSYKKKPEGHGEKIGRLEKSVEVLQDRLIEEQKSYSARLAEQSKLHAAEIEKLKKEISDLKSQKVVIEDDKS